MSVDMSAVLKQLKETYTGGAYDELNQINQKYLLLNAYFLTADAEFKKAFLESPYQLLEEFVGMKIPNDVTVVFDTNDRRWPKLQVSTEKGTFDYSEEAAAVKQNKYFGNGEIDSQTVVRAGAGRVTLYVPEKSNECRNTVVLPWFVPDSDLITEYKFEGDGYEIILSCC